MIDNHVGDNFWGTYDLSPSSSSNIPPITRDYYEESKKDEPILTVTTHPLKANVTPFLQVQNCIVPFHNRMKRKKRPGFY